MHIELVRRNHTRTATINTCTDCWNQWLIFPLGLAMAQVLSFIKVCRLSSGRPGQRSMQKCVSGWSPWLIRGPSRHGALDEQDTLGLQAIILLVPTVLGTPEAIDGHTDARNQKVPCNATVACIRQYNFHSPVRRSYESKF